MKRIGAGLLTVVLLMPLLARAEDEDGPGRGVARISLINGDVSVLRGDSGDWIAAAVNAPLVVYDNVVTGPNSRAEVQFDWANMIRLAANTEIRLVELENQRYQVQLSRGTVTLRVLRDSAAEIEVNTPSVSVRPDRKGSYRVTVNDQGESEITVRSGEAEMYSPTGVERLHSGRTMLVRGTPDNPEFREISSISRDAWDRWNEDRDRLLERSQSYRYVSRDIYGADDLDGHGRWVYVPPHGWVWSPYGVAGDWAPYRHGRWAWVDWYGWTWVSYDPWGWAPYHYGRWFHHAPYGWCWYPGGIHVRHHWRPALVAFVGFGVGNVHVGAGFGRVGWVPLAPHEPFHPWYGRHYYGGLHGRTHVDNRIRIVNNVNITNVYRNARIVNGVSGIHSRDFVRGGRARPMRISEAEFRNAHLVQGSLPMAPSRESVRFSDRQARPGIARPRPSESRYFSSRPAPRIERVSFEEQRKGMEHMVRTFQPGARNEGAGAARAAGPGSDSGAARNPRGELGGRVANGNSAGANAGNSGGWRRIGGAENGDRRVSRPGTVMSRPDSGATRNMRTDLNTRVAANNPGENAGAANGWRRFGEPVRRNSSRSRTPAKTDNEAGASRSETPANAGAGNSSSGEGGLWRRLGERNSERTPRSNQPSTARPSEARESERGTAVRSESNWRQFNRNSARDSDRSGAAASSSSSHSGQRWGAPEPRQGSDSGNSVRSGRESRAIRINPPIVRERADRNGGGVSRPSRTSEGRIRGGGNNTRSGGGEARSRNSAGSAGSARGKSSGGSRSSRGRR